MRLIKECYVKWLITVIALLRGYSIDQIKFLIAQSALETGNWSAKYWYSDKNLFGMSEMTNPQRRQRLKGVRLGPDGLYRAQFYSLMGSIQDRLDWDNQFLIPQKNYAKEVSKRYHPSVDYLLSVTNRIDNNITYAIYLTLILTPLITYLIIKWKF